MAKSILSLLTESRKWGAALVAFSLILAASPGLGQTFRGALVGTVLDQTGAAIPGAKVTAKNPATGLARTTVTDDSGDFNIPELPIGVYSLAVEKAGFQTATVADLHVDVAGERRADVTLLTGRVEAVVEVTEAAPLVQTTVDVLGGTLEAQQVATLPVNGRDYTKLIYMVPGVTGSPDQITDSPGSFGVFSVNGARGRANNFLLDGTDMNDGYRNDPTINQAGVFGTPATILPVDAVSELAVLSNFMPEYGRNAGAVINIVTKSGTNDFHGTAADFFRNDALDARNFFNPGPTPKTSFHNNQYGASLGGPIIRDKTFFFADYEGQRETGGLNSLACVPTQAQIAAASTGITVNPVIALLLAKNPWPAANLGAGGCPNASTTTHILNNVTSLIGKIDHNVNENNLVTGRYYYGDSKQSFPLGLQGGGVLPGYNTVTPTNINLVSLSWVHILSPTKVNEARAGYNRFAETFFPEDHSFDPNSIGLKTVSSSQDFGLPDIRVSGFAQIGANDSLPRGRVDTNWQFIDSFSWKLNRHEVKVGYEFRRTPVAQFFDENFRGRIKFSSLSNFLQGIPSGGRNAQGNSRRDTAQNSHGAYVQDSFRWTHKLTLNAGVRWDYFGLIHEKHNLLSNFDPTNGLRLVGTSTLPRLYEPDYNNFAPRASLAYDVTGNGKTIIRAGAGIFYDIFEQDMFLGQLPFNTFNPGPAYNPVGPEPFLFAGSTNPIVSGQPVFSNFSQGDVFAIDRHARTPYMGNYNFNLQQQFSNKVALQVGYVGSAGRKLFRYRDINQSTQAEINSHNPGSPSGECCAPRPFDNLVPPLGGTFFYVNQIESTAVSNYNSLQTSLRIHGWKGYESTLNYTYSHSIDNSSDAQDFVANATQPNNSYRPDLEKGNSNFDVRHRFVWLSSYEFPKRQGSASKLTDGWGVNAVITLQAGQPFHLNLSDDYDGTGEFFPRPDVVGNPWAGTRSPDNFLNLASFAVPCTLNPTGDGFADACLQGTQHSGSMGRNSLYGPNFKQFDFSIFKNTQITERLNLQFRAEFYNLPNHPNFASPLYPNFEAFADNNGIDPVTGHGIGFLPLTETGDVGVGNPFLGGGGPRGIQLALKFSF
jgi:carboxypeptidase family protein/TonB-dependent receptor-like protein